MVISPGGVKNWVDHGNTEGMALQGMGCGVNHISCQLSHPPKNNTHTKKHKTSNIDGHIRECFIVTNLSGQNI